MRVAGAIEQPQGKMARLVVCLVMEALARECQMVDLCVIERGIMGGALNRIAVRFTDRLCNRYTRLFERAAALSAVRAKPSFEPSMVHRRRGRGWG